MASWLRQTSTILGISTLLGVLVSVLLGECTWLVGLPVAVGAVASMLLPGQPDASTLAGKIAIEVVAATNPSTRPAALRELSRDIPRVVTAVLGPEKVATDQHM